MSYPDALFEEEQQTLWERTRHYFLERGCHDILLRDLAGQGGWFASRSDDRVADFVCLPWKELCKLSGFGRTKIDRLLSVLSAAADSSAWDGAEEAHIAESWEAALQRLGVTEGFPVGLMPLPARIQDFCREVECPTLGGMLRLYEREGGEQALLKRRNLGRSSVGTIERLYQAACRADEKVLAEFVPLRPGSGLHLAEGLALLLKGTDAPRRTALRGRLLENRTLDAVGLSLGVSRERIRQLEMPFLESAAALLDWFESERDWCFAQLEAELPSVAMFEPLPPEDRALAQAMVERVFQESPGGVARAEKTERLHAEWLRELRASPDFYLGRIVTSDWVGSHGGETLAMPFLRRGAQDGEWSLDENAGRLQPATCSLKRVARVLLQGRQEIDAEEWLADLRGVEFFRELTLDQLKRNHQNWRDDPAFPTATVRFPAATGRTLLPAQQPSAEAQIRRVITAATRTAVPELPELDACNWLVISSLASSGGVGIMGLLPLAESDQRRVMTALRVAHGGSVRALLGLVVRYPGAACYALTLAAAEGMSSGEFWPPMAAALGLDLPPPRHPQLSEAFRVASISVGLLAPDARAGNLIWPFVFQAGVVPHFVDPLARTIKRYLAGNPPPDFEVYEERRAFADAIREGIPAGYVRLRDMLASFAGPCVCTAILRAHREDCFEQLPPHLCAPMREAFKDTDRAHFSAPRLEFQRAGGEVVLHLPRLPRRLVLPTSCWSVGDEKTQPVDESANLPVGALNAQRLRVGVRLRPPFGVWTRELALWPDPADRPQIFRLPDGRQTDPRPEADRAIRLPVGAYAVVVAKDVPSNVQDGWTALETGCRWIEYDAFPGQIPLEIGTGPAAWRIVPRVEAAVTVLTGRGNHRLATADGEWIYYGDELWVSLFVPPEQASPGEAFELVCADEGGRVARRMTFDGGVFTQAGSGCEVPGEWMRQTLDELPTGIHVLRIELLSARSSAQRKLIFWKGLRYPKSGWGFRCAVPLDNVLPDECRGVRATEDGLAVGTATNAPEVQLRLAHPPLTLSLARPGITLRLVDSVTGENRAVADGVALACAADDATRVLVECNDLGRWFLLAGDVPVQEFSEGTGQYAGRVAGFFHEYGDVVALRMRSPGGTVLPLLTLTRLAMAEGFRCELKPGENCYAGSFRLPEVYTEVGLALRPLLAAGEAAASVAALPVVPGSGRMEWAWGAAVDWEVAAQTGEHLLVFRLERTALACGVYLADFYCRKAGEEAWTPLRAPDASGSAAARLCFVSHPFVPVPGAPALDTLLAGAWTDLTLAGEPSAVEAGAASLRDEEAIIDCFERVSGTLNHAYPSAGWRSVKWMRRALTAVCRQGVQVCPGALGTLAAVDLAARARENDFLYRPSAFGLPALWAMDGAGLRVDRLTDDLVGRCFAGLAALGGGRVLNEFFALPISQAVDFVGVIPYLQGGRDRYDRFFRDIGRNVFELDGSDQPAETLPLLGAEHFCRALYRLERVARAVTQVKRLVTTDESRDRRAMISHLLGLDRRLPVLAGFVKSRLGMSNAVPLDIELYASSPASEVRRLLLALTALARLQAAGRVSRTEASWQLETLFEATSADPTPIHKGLSLLTGLGGDFFACTLLFWELTLRAQA